MSQIKWDDLNRPNSGKTSTNWDAECFPSLKVQVCTIIHNSFKRVLFGVLTLYTLELSRRHVVRWHRARTYLRLLGTSHVGCSYIVMCKSRGANSECRSRDTCSQFLVRRVAVAPGTGAWAEPWHVLNSWRDWNDVLLKTFKIVIQQIIHHHIIN